MCFLFFFITDSIYAEGVCTLLWGVYRVLRRTKLIQLIYETICMYFYIILFCNSMNDILTWISHAVLHDFTICIFKHPVCVAIIPTFKKSMLNYLHYVKR